MKNFTIGKITCLYSNLDRESERHPLVKLYSPLLDCEMLVPLGKIHYISMLHGNEDKLVLEFIRGLSCKPEEVFLDIGGNVGSMTLFANRVCGMKTISFEPHPGMMELLETHLTENGKQPYKTHQVALSDANGQINMDPAFHCSQIRECENPLEVPRMKLDDFSDISNVCGIKLDVEAHELAVIRGARESLKRWGLPPMITEVHAGVDPNEVRSLLRSIGYNTFHIGKQQIPDQTKINGYPALTCRA